ncbi:MAG: hypothetical protein PHG85_01710 [Candidatus Altiarchaeota archaeon]|nr:hypothetical protein [Candidatus Altiarchaeota archaeon]
MKCCSHCQDYRYCDENLGECCKYCYQLNRGKCSHQKAKEINSKIG